MNASRTFYADLPPVVELLDALDPSCQTVLPEDWDLHLADVVDSTGAIARGEYRSVNLAAVLALVAARNAVDVAVPFSFGGDGMLLAAPSGDRAAIRAALAGIAKRVSSRLDLDLRVGTLSHRDLLAQDAPVRVAKQVLAPWAHQAAFSGQGTRLAEHILKHDNSCLIPSSEAGEPDLSGFECRWRPVRSSEGEILSLLVETPQPELLRMVLRQVELVYGPPLHRNPLEADRLHLGWSWSAAAAEARLTGATAARVWALTQLGRLLMNLGIRQGPWNWAAYKEDLVRASDFQKLEGSLRMVLRGTAAKRQKLVDWLASLENHGLRWGVHVSSTALVTCAVRDYGSDHIHFVDGADGGYAMASLDLRKRFAKAS
jgi:hypothetical protein